MCNKLQVLDIHACPPAPYWSVATEQLAYQVDSSKFTFITPKQKDSRDVPACMVLKGKCNVQPWCIILFVTKVFSKKGPVDYFGPGSPVPRATTTRRFKFWRHYDLIIGASALLKTSALLCPTIAPASLYARCSIYKGLHQQQNVSVIVTKYCNNHQEIANFKTNI